MKRMKQQQQQQQQESLLEKIHRYRGVLVLVSVPTLLVFFVLFFMPRSPVDTIVSSSSDVLLHRRPFVPGNGGDDDAVSKSYAVIFDAGSSGSRVHVYCFDSNLDLLPIRKDLELFVQTKPGLSAYANDPQKAAESLSSLLDEAVNVVPPELHSTTPVRVGATAGLRALGENVSENILKAVRNFLEEKSSFKTRPDWVTVLDGNQEGAFQWVTINYLLGNLGKKYSNTVGVVDLGGGSVQMAYAISEEDAAKAPSISNGEESYVKELLLKGTKYYLYVHSYLHYGLLAARAEILKAFDDSGNVCSLSGFHGKFKYGGEKYDASASTAGPNFDGCKRAAVRALKVDESTCTHMKCTFGGVWNGGGGDGQKNLFVASFFFDRAAEAGFVDPTVPFAKVKPMDFKDAAKRACETSLENAKAIYPRVEENNLPFLCMDLSYQYALLVDGFGLDPWQEIKLVKQVKYRDSLVEAAWPLGSAIEVASSTT